MRLRRLVLVAVLLYVGLDLSLAMMPGAFVFDVGDSVESVQTQRGRPTDEIPPTAAQDSALVAQSHADVDRGLVLHREVIRRGRPAVNVLPRAALSPAPPSEDPQ